MDFQQTTPAEKAGGSESNSTSYSKRIKKFVLISLGVFAFIGTIAGYGIYTINQPATGTILPPKQQPETLGESTKDFSNTYFTTAYSSIYELRSADTKKSPLIYQSWMLIARSDQDSAHRRKIAISVSKLPEGGVTEDGAYKLYLTHPDLYSLSRTTYGEESVIIAKRHDPIYEQTILWPHKQYLLTLSLTADTETEAVNSELRLMASKLQWQN